MSSARINYGMCLQELEKDDWGNPEEGETSLVQKCLSLRRKPIASFSTEDLRLMIGQQIGLQYLMPKAIELVRNNPLAEGDFYPGDLMQAIIETKPAFWQSHPALWREVNEIITENKSQLIEAGIEVHNY